MNQSPDTFPDKHPTATRPYGIDWTEDLAEGDTIDSSTWEIEGPDEELTQSAAGAAENKTVVWLSGGTLGAQYKITNRITTTPNPPKTLVSVMRINVRNT